MQTAAANHGTGALTWHVLAPSLDSFVPEALCTTSSSEQHDRLLSMTAKARAEVFDFDCGGSDKRAWHIVATDGSCVVGSVRLVVIDRREATRLRPEALLDIGEIVFACHDIRSLYLDVLQELLEQSNDHFFIYVGPMFVAAGFLQHQWLGATLVLGANALFRLHRCRLGVSFADVHAVSLFTRLGGYPLTRNEAALPAFFCTRHRRLGCLLGIDPLKVSSDLERYLTYFLDWLASGVVQTLTPDRMSCD